MEQVGFQREPGPQAPTPAWHTNCVSLTTLGSLSGRGIPFLARAASTLPNLAVHNFDVLSCLLKKYPQLYGSGPQFPNLVPIPKPEEGSLGKESSSFLPVPRVPATAAGTRGAACGAGARGRAEEAAAESCAHVRRPRAGAHGPRPGDAAGRRGCCALRGLGDAGARLHTLSVLGSPGCPGVCGKWG